MNEFWKVVTMTNRDAVIVGGSRTPFCEWSGGKRGDGSPGGRLASISAEDLGSLAIKGAVAKTQTNPEEIEQVIMGHALQTSNQAIFGARHAGLKAGIPQEVPMLTLNSLNLDMTEKKTLTKILNYQKIWKTIFLLI